MLYRNDGSTRLTVTLEALRPRNGHDTDPDEFVLLVHAPDITELRGTRRITARGHHRVYKDELTVPVEQLNDVGEGTPPRSCPKRTPTPRTPRRTRAGPMPVLIRRRLLPPTVVAGSAQVGALMVLLTGRTH